MQKFVVIELNDEESCIDLLSYCVKRNLERVSLLTRLEDHPYIREMNDREINPDVEIQDPESVLVQLNDEERQRLLNIINSPGAQTLALERIHHPSQDQHLLQQHQIPSTSAYNENPAMIYIQRNNSSYKDEPQSSMSQFDATVNSVAHGHAGLPGIFSCDGSPNSTDNLRRKTPSRKAEDSIKATCKECGHDVMYSPQRTWNLMRHVWIMHESSKPYRCSLCDYSHIKPYVRKHIDSQHKHQNADILDNKSSESESEWAQLLDQCFGVTYRKWKHHKEDTQHTVFAAAEEDYGHEHHFSPEEDVMVTL